MNKLINVAAIPENSVEKIDPKASQGAFSYFFSLFGIPYGPSWHFMCILKGMWSCVSPQADDNEGGIQVLS